jgi:replicative DNA helicase
MVIHEYGTGMGNVTMFRSYIEQLQNRAGFKPDVIVVDHIQNCKPTGSATGLNLYQSYGLVAKELRQLAQEMDIPVWSAAQANRQGQNGRLDLTNIGDSLQIVQDADTVLMMWRDESLPDYVHVSVPKRREAGSRGEAMFVMDTARMKLFELDAGACMAVQDALERTKNEKPKKPAKKEAVLFDIDGPGAVQ